MKVWNKIYGKIWKKAIKNAEKEIDLFSIDTMRNGFVDCFLELDHIRLTIEDQLREHVNDKPQT